MSDWTINPAVCRRVVDADWLITHGMTHLHRANGLDNQQVVTLVDDGCLDGPLWLACGRTTSWVRLPGLGDRRTMPRCPGCCSALGIPEGKGSPKNYPEVGKALGIDGKETA